MKLFLNLRFNKEKIFLLGVFFLALTLRVFRLNNLPYGFHGDEIRNGYVGRFILLNGKDLYGNSWPIFYFNQFGDYPNVIPMYISGLATFIFGVNEFALRFPSAFFGALTIFPFYFLGLEIFKNKKIAIFPPFLLTITPWHIILSRASSEGILGLTAFSFSIWWILKYLKTNNRKFLFSSIFGFLFTYFLYPSFRIFTPLSLLGLILFFLKKENKKSLFLINILFFSLTFLISQTYWGQGRFKQTSLFYSEEVSNRIKANLEALSFDLGSQNIIHARIFHNKIVAYIREIFSQYFNYFSFKFLFLEGGLPYRYTVPYQGVLLISFFPLLFSILLNIKNKNIKSRKLIAFMGYLLLISPLPAALTIDDVPNIHRAIPMIFPLIFILSVGFYNFISFFTKVKYLWFFLVLVEFCYFWNQYQFHTASFRSYLRNDGDKELILYLLSQQDKYEKIYLPTYGILPIYYLFYNNNFSGTLAGKFRLNLEIDQIGKYVFVKEWCPEKILSKEELINQKIIIASQGDCKNELGGLRIIKEIFRRDSTRAYRILTAE